MILGRGEQHEARAVAQGHHRDLAADETLLDDHAAASVAEGAVDQHGAHRSFRLVVRGGHDHALARAKAVGLDHHVARLRVDEGVGRGHVGKTTIGRRGDSGPPHQILGELLATLDFRGRARRTEAAQTRRHAGVAQPSHERHLGTAHHEIDLLRLGQRDQLRDRLGPDVDHGHAARSQTAAERRDTRIAGRREQAIAEGALQQFPRQGVLTPARADQ